jgi:hypothetical protein
VSALQKTAAALHFLKEIDMVRRVSPVAVLYQVGDAASSMRSPSSIAGTQSKAEA